MVKNSLLLRRKEIAEAAQTGISAFWDVCTSPSQSILVMLQEAM